MSPCFPVEDHYLQGHRLCVGVLGNNCHSEPHCECGKVFLADPRIPHVQTHVSYQWVIHVETELETEKLRGEVPL